MKSNVFYRPRKFGDMCLARFPHGMEFWFLDDNFFEDDEVKQDIEGYYEQNDK